MTDEGTADGKAGRKAAQPRIVKEDAASYQTMRRPAAMPTGTREARRPESPAAPQESTIPRITVRTRPRPRKKPPTGSLALLLSSVSGQAVGILYCFGSDVFAITGSVALGLTLIYLLEIMPRLE